MKKKSLLFILMGILLLMNAGCSSGDKQQQVAVNADTIPYLEAYNKQAMNYIQNSNQLLVEFNRGVDGLYTQELSPGQFGTLLRKTIPESQSLLEELETANVDSNLLSIHQELIALGNHQHQLFLDAMDMVNENATDNTVAVDKAALRADYLSIKSEQSAFLTKWKETTKQLEDSSKNSNFIKK